MCAISAVCGSSSPKSRIPARRTVPRSKKCIVCAAAINAEFNCLNLVRSAVFSLLVDMRPSLQLPLAPGKKLAACLCLFAVLCLWAPAWAIAWQAQPMDCCAGGMCSSHGHHSRPSKPASAPVDCEHHGSTEKSSGLTGCAVSCCHAPEIPAVVSTIFVMPLSTLISAPVVALAPQSQIILVAFAHTSEPLSPPPRA